MKETVEALKHRFDALSAKVDPTSCTMLRDPDYTTQLAECVANIYVMLNSGMCEELTVCRNCAELRDYLRQAMEVFDTAAQSGKIDNDLERFYFDFVGRLRQSGANLEAILHTF